MRPLRPDLYEMDEGDSFDRHVSHAFVEDVRERVPALGDADPFWVKTLVTPEGHEVLTRSAASGVPGISAADVASLLIGVRRVDLGSLSSHFSPADQKRHFLRRDVCQDQASAVRDAAGHLRTLYSTAAGSSPRATKMEWIGEALHLIQDSFSAAHVDRAGCGAGDVLYVRFYGLASLPAPIEHMVPADLRDRVNPAAPAERAAITATRAFLEMIGRHFGTSPPPAAVRSAELGAFIAAVFRLSPSHTSTKSRYGFFCP